MKSDEEKLKENSGSEDKDKKEMELDNGDVKKVDTTSSSDATAADSTKEEENETKEEEGETKEDATKSSEKKVESVEDKMNGKDNGDIKEEISETKEQGSETKEEGEKEEGEAEEGEAEDAKKDKSQQVMDTSSDKEKQQANEKEKDKPEKAEEKQEKPSSQDNNTEDKKNPTETEEEKAMDVEESTKNTETSNTNGKSSPSSSSPPQQQSATTVDSTSKESNSTDNIKESSTTPTNNNNTTTTTSTTTSTTTNIDNSNNSNSNNNDNNNNNSNNENNNQTDRPAETEPYEEVDKKKIEEELKEKREHMAENIVISSNGNGTNGISTANGSGEDDEEMEEEYESAFAKNQEPAISKSSYSANKEADLETKKRLECLGNMERIEKEFTDLKEKFFNDKLTQIKKEIEEIKLGEHLSFQERMRELELKKERKIAIAENWKKYQIQSILNMYDAECKQYEDEHNEEASHLRERMVSTLSERQKRISEEKESMRMNDGESRITTRTRRRTQQPSQPQNVALKKKQNPPAIVYSLKDNEIMDDYNIIFKSRR